MVVNTIQNAKKNYNNWDALHAHFAQAYIDGWILSLPTIIKSWYNEYVLVVIKVENNKLVPSIAWRGL